MRRRPRQGRSQQRVAAILDAAEQLYAEQGYEAVSTNEIAARAATSIGSLYQFFPNKEAVLHGAAERYRAGFAALAEELLSVELGARPLPALIDHLLEIVISYGGEHIGMTRVMLQPSPSPLVAAATEPIMGDLRACIAQLLAQHAPQLAAERRDLIAAICVSAMMAVIAHAIAEKLAGRYERMYAIFAELRILLVAYIRTATDG
jgi:AcrR family transcriptional regulator